MESVDALEQQCSKLETERKEKAAQVDKLKKKVEFARKRLDEAKELEKKFSELEEAKSALKDLEDQLEAQKMRKVQLALARRAVKVVPAHDRLEERTKELTGVEAHVKTAEDALRDADGILKGAAETREKEEGRDDERELLRQQITQLQGLIEKVGQVEAASKVLEQAKKGHEMAVGRLSGLQEKLELIEKDLEGCRDELEQKKEVSAQLELRETRLKEAEARLERFDKLVVKKASLETAKTRTKNGKKSQEEHSQTLNGLEAEKDEALRRWHGSQAAVLAEELEDGVACPVCGATEHPEPAKPDVDSITEDEYKHAVEAHRNAQSETDEILAAASKARDVFTRIDSEVATLLEQDPALEEKERGELELDKSNAKEKHDDAKSAIENMDRLVEKETELAEALKSSRLQ